MHNKKKLIQKYNKKKEYEKKLICIRYKKKSIHLNSCKLFCTCFGLLMILAFFEMNLRVDEVFTYRLSNVLCHISILKRASHMNRRNKCTENIFRLTISAGLITKMYGITSHMMHTHPVITRLFTRSVRFFGSFSISCAGAVSVIFALLTLFLI